MFNTKGNKCCNSKRLFFTLKKKVFAKRRPKKVSLAKLEKSVADDHMLWLCFSCSGCNHWFAQSLVSQVDKKESYTQEQCGAKEGCKEDSL